MSESFGTLVNRLGRGSLLVFTAGLFSLHIGCYLVTLLTSPQLFIINKDREDSGIFSLGTAKAWNRRLGASLQLRSSEPFPESLNFSASLITSTGREFRIEDAERILDCERPSSYSSEEHECNLDPLFTLYSLHDNETLELSLNTSELYNNTLHCRRDSPNHHKTLFFFKCLFTPALLISLVYFSWKIHVNDLYISIPDRCLLVAGASLLLRNIPLQVLFFQDEAYIALYEPLNRGLLTCSLYLFWLIYSGDKASDKESWERNSRYYWKQILLVVLFAVLHILHIIFSLTPSLRNPFLNHWNLSRATRLLSLGFRLSSVAYVVFPLQISLSATICRILFQHRRRKDLPRRLGWMLMYLYLSSLITTGDYLLRESLELGSLFSIRQNLNGFASILIIGSEGYWNLHVISCFILLSRAPRTTLLKPVTSLGTPRSLEAERKDFDEVMGLSVYKSLLQHKV